MNVLYNDNLGNTWSDVHWQYYTILFSNPIHKNKTHITGIEMPSLHDPKEECDTFASTGIFEPTEELIIRVILPLNLPIKKNMTKIYVYYTYNSRVADEEFSIEPKYNEKNCILEYSIKYPRKNARYRLEWKFE